MLNPIKYLEFRAKMEPEKLALRDLSRSSNYGQLFLLVRKIAKKLEVAGIKPGDLVLTRLPSILDWVFINALFHEACVSCSGHPDDPIDPRLQVDWVISLVPLANFAEDKVLVVDRAWLQDVENGEPSSVIKTFASEDDLCRLIFTGGTTGGAKAVPYSLRLLAERLPTTNPSWSADRDEMALMGLDSVVGFLTALKSSVLGKTFYCPPPDDVVKCANHFKITSLIGSPIQLAGFVKRVELSADGIPPVQEIRVAGGILPQPLMNQLWRLFHAKIYNDYGSTEVGGVCFDLVEQNRRPDRAGWVLPRAEVQIVDELDQAQPFGAEGIVRTKTSGMACEYFKNPEATAKCFKDGWFYPGDRGRLNKNGLLFLTGRQSEIINHGGVKIDPVTIDEHLLAYPGIEDAAAFGFMGKSGFEQVAIALVAKEDFDIPALHSGLVKKFGAPVCFVRVKQIPRNQMGKVVRGQLRGRLSAILAEHERRTGTQVPNV